MEQYTKTHFTSESKTEYESFFIFPKFLLESPEFLNLSIYAKMLYTIMLDRTALSLENGWVDSENHVYIYFTLKDIMQHLQISKGKSIKVLAELDEKTGVGLIRKKRLGLGKPSVIYVMQVHEDKKSVDNSDEVVDNTDFLKSKNQTSGGRQNRLQEVAKTDSNNTKYNNTEINDTNHIISYRESADERIREREDYKKVIRNNISYNSLVKKYGKKEINAIVNIMLDSVCSNSREIKINKELKLQSIVKKRMLELDMSHIDYVLECLKETKTRIYKMKDYILTALYNSPDTIGQYYTNLLNRSYGTNNGFEHHKTFT